MIYLGDRAIATLWSDEAAHLTGALSQAVVSSLDGCRADVRARAWPDLDALRRRRRRGTRFKIVGPRP